MSKDTSKTNGCANEMGLSLEGLIRRGARELIQNAIEVKVRELLAEYGNVRTLCGKAAVVRDGYLPEREILTTVVGERSLPSDEDAGGGSGSSAPSRD